MPVALPPFAKAIRSSFSITPLLMLQQAFVNLIRTGVIGDLKITASTYNTVTSVGVVTIPDGGTVQVVDGKIWSIL